MRSSQEIRAVEASLLMTEEKYAEASVVLQISLKKILKTQNIGSTGAPA